MASLELLSNIVSENTNKSVRVIRHQFSIKYVKLRIQKMSNKRTLQTERFIQNKKIMLLFEQWLKTKKNRIKLFVNIMQLALLDISRPISSAMNLPLTFNFEKSNANRNRKRPTCERSRIGLNGYRETSRWTCLFMGPYGRSRSGIFEIYNKLSSINQMLWPRT